MSNPQEKPTTDAQAADEAMHHGTHPAAEVWAFGSALYLCMLAIPLITFPRLLVLIASPPTGPATSADGPAKEHHRLTLTPLETFLSMHLGLLLISLALCLFMSIPHASPSDPRPRNGPIQHPLLFPTSAAFGVVALASYQHSFAYMGTLPMLLTLGFGAISLWGFWVQFFAGDTWRSKHGADKHTSAFLFGNKQSNWEKKKELKKEGAR